ncbi:MAG: D-alanyl-D-alanine carboxypeptidase/D-alanyl-D-alanine-endopeptidase [Nocardiaceae bacterium]|nr:D-alanyl-D-alanine carboxypeptidase/D-alanyl-D-alanine-endopeptidase [Nocardiaceae bacterium]
MARFGGRKFRTLMAVAAVIAVVVSLVVLVRASGPTGANATSVAPAPPLVSLNPEIKDLPSGAPIPNPVALQRALGELVTASGLGNFTGEISDAETGRVLWSSEPNKATVPASTAKLLTTAAALLTLPIDHRLTTRIVAGTRPGEIVLVAGGDPTLSAAPAGTPSFYPGAARIDDLVAQIKKSGVKFTSLTLDTSAFTGPAMAQGWHAEDIPGGFIAPLAPVMIDGSRLANDENAPRSDTPAIDVAQAIAKRLGIDTADVKPGKAPANARELAKVQSATLGERMTQMMAHSDNILAETIGRELVIERGGDPSFRGVVSAVTDVLTEAGFDMTGVSIHDASGLSDDDRIPARVLDKIMVAAAGNGRPTLRPMLDFLPVAGANGTLEDRFDAGDRAGAGWVRAKTGTLAEASSLAGFVVTVNSRVLTFALMSNGTAPGVSRPALDAIAAALRACVCR